MYFRLCAKSSCALPFFFFQQSYSVGIIMSFIMSFIDEKTETRGT